MALEAKGKGKFVGWNVTVRSPGNKDFPVDENEKFYVDGEEEAVGRISGLGRLVRFQLGFPRDPKFFPVDGLLSVFPGGCAYRFFTRDAIPLREVAPRDDRFRQA